MSDPIVVPALEVACVPPVGWSAQPPKESKNHVHRVWLSPTGNTAYGVIRFALPVPVGPDAALWGFLREMRRTEGEARLISKQRDARGLTFVAEGGLYMIRTNLTTRGFRGWAVYAGTLRGREIVHNELILAELARDHTETGVDGNPRSTRP
ncbi:MAG: hypothetical protein WBD40_02150 [Tepidisphaeraceae bacterium]